MLRLHAGESCLAAFLPAPTFAVWILTQRDSKGTTKLKPTI